MKKIAEFELSRAPGSDMLLLSQLTGGTKMAVSLIHDDHITDNTKSYNRNLFERLEAGEVVKVSLTEEVK